MSKFMLILFILSVWSIEQLVVPLCKNQSKTKSTQNQTQIGKINYFLNDIDGTMSFTSTKVNVCHDTKFLYFKFVWQSFIISQDYEIISNYKNCNDPLYNQDAIEIFISTVQDYPLQYLEIQLSPKSVLYFADIYNKNQKCDEIEHHYRNCQQVQYNTFINYVSKTWEGQFKLSIKLLGKGRYMDRFRANLFRIDVGKNIRQTKYSCWISTFSNPPCFHNPNYFGELILQ